jgi:hypothetical protein
MARMPTLLELMQMDRNRSQAGAMGDFFNAVQMPMASQPPSPAPQPARAPAAGPMPAQAPAPAPERRGLLGGFFGPEGRDARARLAIGLEGMTLNPNEALIGELQRGIEGRETERQQNKTLEWLASLNTPQAQRALQYAEATGDVIGATKMALEQPDELRALQIETARVNLDRLKSGADADPNVQASAPLPDQSGVVLTMRDGTVQVRTVGGEVLSGQAALDFVRSAQENAAEYQRSIYGARREGALGADIGLGEAAAAAGARGTEIGRAQGEAIAGAPAKAALVGQIEMQVNDLLNDPYLPNMVGPMASRLPNVSGDAARVQSKMDQILGGAFLQARQLLKGGGAITDFESTKAEQAFIRMNAAQNEADFRKAMTDFLDAVKSGLPKLDNGQAGAPATGQTAAPAAPTGGRIRYDENGNRIQ